MSKVIGLCGPIGSGKSLAASLLKQMGAAIVDADALARQVLEPGQPAYAEISAAFGCEYILPSGGVDRKKLGRLIFADADARKRLNAITHPRIYEQAALLILRYREEGYAMIVLEAALLLENESFFDLLDETWLITAAPEHIYNRLAARDALTPVEAAARLAAQMPAEQQAKLAGHIILNNGGVEELRERLAALYTEAMINPRTSQ